MPSRCGTGLAAAATAWSRGALLGARGNSGVIVAQLLRGVAETLAGSDNTETAPLRARATPQGAVLAAALAGRPSSATRAWLDRSKGRSSRWRGCAAAAAAAADHSGVGWRPCVGRC